MDNSNWMEFDAEWAGHVLDEVARVLMKQLPEMKRIAMLLVETVFAPNVVAKQLALAVVLETGAVTAAEFLHVLRAISSRFSSRARLIRHLKQKQTTSETQDEWMDIAEQIDTIQGNDLWRSEAKCELYESDRISARIDEFVHLMRRRDVFDLMFSLRGGISRNKFGLLHEGLFTKALAGSKVLVETYHNVICAALDFVCDAPVLPGEDPVPTDARLAFFNETRHAYGRTAVIFSGGAALGFYHVGVAKALIENGLMPRVLSGSSAGSIVCSMIGTRTDDECRDDLFLVKGTNAPGHSGIIKLDFFRPLGTGKKNALIAAGGSTEKEGELGSVLHNTAGPLEAPKRISTLIFPATLRKFASSMYDICTGQSRAKDILMSDTDHFRECCRVNIGNFTFQEAFDRTGRILNITVSPQNRSDPPRLLNYLTAPHVLVWSAAVASSSLPGVFESNRLLVKDPDGSERYESAAGVKFQDGSMEADLPMQQLSEMFNINHFIISQVNPHAIMFSSLGKDLSVWSGHVIGSFHSILVFLKDQVKSYMRHFVELIGGRRVAPIWDTKRGFLTQFFTQEYVGRDIDITVCPWAGDRTLFSSFLHLLYNPSEQEFEQWGHAAERETWKQIPRLKSHCAVEMTLDRCVQRLRRRLLAESWEHRQHHSSMARTASESTQEKMGKRVPSFFNSPSLVNLGGLNVGDQCNLQGFEMEGAASASAAAGMMGQNGGHMMPSNGSDMMMMTAEQELPLSHHHIEISPGWGGMGLKGNHPSASNLHRSNSGGSGLFIMDPSDDEPELASVSAGVTPIATGAGGSTRDNGEANEEGGGELSDERPSLGRRPSSLHDLPAQGSSSTPPPGYIKTTSMANFYYRKTKSTDNLVGHAANVFRAKAEP